MSEIGAHKLVMKTAVGIAEYHYERNASDNEFHRLHKNRKQWLRMIAPCLIDDARDILMATAQDDGTAMSERLDIYDALVLDEQIPEAHRRVQQAVEKAVAYEVAQHRKHRTE